MALTPVWFSGKPLVPSEGHIQVLPNRCAECSRSQLAEPRVNLLAVKEAARYVGPEAGVCCQIRFALYLVAGLPAVLE